MTKRITILGSTGSIGKNALEVIDSLGGQYVVAALSANSSIDLLAEQARKYRPEYIAVTDPSKYKHLKQLTCDLDIEILNGPDSLITIAELDQVDTVLTAVVGAAGLPATIAAAEKGKNLAVANKEPLVIAGQLLTETLKETGGQILPIDSEHSAVFQSMRCGKAEEVKKIVLTASGGPFRNFTMEEIENVTVEQALDHPTWQMGPKITIDSATMMNKALEVIEAKWLFDIPVDKIDIIIHPESIVHSFVEYVDGAVIAQLGAPDMKVPIQYALTWPDRVEGIGQRLDLQQISSLTFEQADMKKFRALALGYQAARQGGSAPVVFNAANEQAVQEFLEGKIKFVSIVGAIEHCLEVHQANSRLGLEELIEIDQWSRKEVTKWINARTR